MRAGADPALVAEHPAPPAQAQVPAAVPLATLGDGEPSPRVLCAGPGCFQPDTRKYGFCQLPLRTPAPQPLTSQACQRELPPGAARARQHRRSA